MTGPARAAAMGSEPCPKCGSIEHRYHHLSAEATGGKEAMEMTCTVCGYIWQRAPLDAE